MSPRPTLSDVATRAGVSKATASRVLGGSRDRVSDDLIARVSEAATALAYVPNPHAKALARASSPTVALIVHDIGDPYFAEIARGALGVAGEQGRLVTICTTFLDPDREVAYVAEMRAQSVHAILLAGTSRAGLEAGGRLAAQLDAYVEEGGRVAVMAAGLGLPAVVPDDRSGAEAAARHLLDLGHREIAVVAGPDRLASADHRLGGVTAVLEAEGLQPVKVVQGGFTVEGGESAAVELLGARVEFTAVVALNDLMALGVLRQLAEAGLAVPADVSVVGFDDIPWAADLTPALTTVRVPMAGLGAAAMELVLEAGARVEHLVLDTELVIRSTTGPPPTLSRDGG